MSQLGSVSVVVVMFDGWFGGKNGQSFSGGIRKLKYNIKISI